MEEVRSFIAIELPDEVKQELTQLEDRLKLSNQPWVRWVNPYSIHVTLKFLGNVATDRIDQITRSMEEASRGIAPFHLEVRELGVFPNLKRVQVAWVGVKGEVDTVQRLQQRIESGLVPLGFAAESRRFTPHLTLARVSNRASPNERQRFGELIASSSFEAVHSIEVNAVSLMKSQLSREGAIYTRIGSAALK